MVEQLYITSLITFSPVNFLQVVTDWVTSNLEIRKNTHSPIPLQTLFDDGDNKRYFNRNLVNFNVNTRFLILPRQMSCRDAPKGVSLFYCQNILIMIDPLLLSYMIWFCFILFLGAIIVITIKIKNK